MASKTILSVRAKVSVLIPCYNEEATIEELLRRVEAADFGAWQKEIIVVDDGSKDKTRSILAKYRGKDPYRIIFHEKNKGKGGVERTGIAEASGDYIILQDADLEYDPREIRKMLNAVNETGAPVVFGSRNLESNWQRAFKGFFLISLGVWLSTKLVNLLYGTRLTDAWTCYKLFSREVADKARFIGNGFEADYIFIGEVAVAGFPIIEVPISHYPRTVEEGKKIRYKDGWYSMWLLLKHRFLHLRKPLPGKESPAAKKRSNAVISLAVCPECRGKLLRNKHALACSAGHGPFSAKGVPHLLSTESFLSVEEELASGVNWLKSFLKQFPWVYYKVWQAVCPVLMAQNGPKKILKFIPASGWVADIGSGPLRLGDRFVNVDVFPFPEVDLAADAAKLPFADGTFEGAVTESLLEHVADAKKVAKEIIRIVKPGGYVYASAPFIHPYHASPDDYGRWTGSGLRELFSELEIIEQGVRSGPWSAFLVSFAYTLGVIFAFGSRRAAPFLAHLFMIPLGPLKVLDLLVAKLPGAAAVSAHLYIIGRKS